MRNLFVVLLVLVFFGGFYSPPLHNKSFFSLSITTYNHAEQLFDGILIFKLKETHLTVSRTYMFSNKTTELFSKTVSTDFKNEIKNVPLTDLREYYFNSCVLPTSGNEYFISTKTDAATKSITLHHYYLPQIDTLVTKLNTQLPDSLQIHYLSSNTEQNCDDQLYKTK